VPDELGVDTALANAPGNQLRVLAAQIDDDDRPLLRRTLWQRQDFSGDSSAPLS
jgi:hypothetical protein